ncbi:MAG TPA: glutaminase A [Stellaceae bacterium]
MFTLILALNRGSDEIWTRVGKEPSGSPFNDLAILETERGAPRNPFVKAGALAVTDYLLSRSTDIVALLIAFIRFSGGIEGGLINETVAASERTHAFQNRAIANILRLYGTICNDPDAVVDAYCRQCAVEFSVRDLARVVLPLAASGFSRHAGETIMTARLVRRVNAVMMTCGMYDATGNFAYRVSLPAKSGVGGGIVAVAPGRGVVAIWSPELDRAGNSLVGTLALELFTHRTGWSVALGV